MPLPPVNQTTRTQDISELIKSFKRKGTIGNTKPGSMTKARSIAAAIAFDRHPKET